MRADVHHPPKPPMSNPSLHEPGARTRLTQACGASFSKLATAWHAFTFRLFRLPWVRLWFRLARLPTGGLHELEPRDTTAGLLHLALLIIYMERVRQDLPPRTRARIQEVRQEMRSTIPAHWR